jgi:ribosomal protein L11 methyltransferase
MRIGTNHGSLSDRIMNRFGDTPLGMVESALEFAHIARKMNYHNFVFSMKSSNPKTWASRISLSKIRRTDWANSWKRHFKPFDIGGVLLIRPSWSRHRVRSGQALVQIDPGLAFGTGQHPTTSFCLEEIVARRDSRKEQSFLDLGTGSGILAIAACKLGYAPIEAVDNDAAAIRIAVANARKNRVAHAIRFVLHDLARLPSRKASRYDVICANLISTLLIKQKERLLSRLRPGGILVLAGILNREFARVQKAYEASGLTLLSSQTDKEWRSGSFASLSVP